MQKLSFLGNNIVGSEIIKISQQIKEVSKSKPVENFSIGDFNPVVNPIPEKLKNYIVESYENNLTNYPMSSGELDLRTSISNYLRKKRKISYNEDEILVGCGVRPLIYTIFKSIVDPGDVVMYPVPSWNNDHYTFLQYAFKRPIETLPENNFNITLEDVRKIS